MSSIICPACKGLKKRLGLGLLEEDCHKCNKTGRVPADSVTPVKTSSASDTSELRDDLRKISDAYSDAQTEIEKLNAEIASLRANKVKTVKKGKSK